MFAIEDHYVFLWPKTYIGQTFLPCVGASAAIFTIEGHYVEHFCPM
jgi:hypothetical protein